MAANDRQEGGSHYRAEIQHWDYVAANNLNYFEGQITKYVTRCRKKGGIRDLKKAQHFLEKYMEIFKEMCPEIYVEPEQGLAIPNPVPMKDPGYPIPEDVSHGNVAHKSRNPPVEKLQPLGNAIGRQQLCEVLCPRCGGGPYTEEFFVQHHDTACRNRTTTPIVMSYKCDRCGTKFDNFSEYTRHDGECPGRAYVNQEPQVYRGNPG